jgi:hypothetical protein
VENVLVIVAAAVHIQVLGAGIDNAGIVPWLKVTIFIQKSCQ